MGNNIFEDEISIPQAKAHLKRGTYINNDVLVIDDFDENSFPKWKKKTRCLMIIICEEGTLKYDYHDHTVTAHKDDIVLINNSQTVSNYRVTDGEYHGKAIFVNPEHINTLATDFCSTAELYNKINDTEKSSFSHQEIENIENLLQQIQQRRIQNSTQYLSYTLNLIKIILQLSLENTQPTEQNTSTTNNILTKFENTVAQNLQNQLSIHKYCKMLNISYTTLEKITKASFNLTPSQYLRRRRINKICIMLESTVCDSTQIAKWFHFGSSSALIRAFKKEKHMTPSEYRKKYAHPLHKEQ